MTLLLVIALSGYSIYLQLAKITCSRTSHTFSARVLIEKNCWSLPSSVILYQLNQLQIYRYYIYKVKQISERFSNLSVYCWYKTTLCMNIITQSDYLIFQFFISKYIFWYFLSLSRFDWMNFKLLTALREQNRFIMLSQTFFRFSLMILLTLYVNVILFNLI